jgi:hypothetical protein
MHRSSQRSPRQSEALLLVFTSLIAILGYLMVAAAAQLRQSFDPLASSSRRALLPPLLLSLGVFGLHL